MGNQQDKKSFNSPLAASSLLIIAGLVCAITTEELLGYQILDWGGTTLSSYALLCGFQALFAVVLMATGPRITSLVRRPLCVTMEIAVALLGSVLVLASQLGGTLALSLGGFVLLCLASFCLKIMCLEVLCEVRPGKLAPLLFAAVLIQALGAPLFTLSTAVSWSSSGIVAVGGTTFMVGAQHLGARSAFEPTASPRFQRPFRPSLSVLVGIGIICASISFLNPLTMYLSISQDFFLFFTFLTHFLAALLFGAVAFLSRDSSYGIAFKSVDSLVLVGFFLMALLGVGSLLPRALCTTVFSLFEFVTFLAIADLASFSSTNRLRLFGGYYLLIRTASLAGIGLNADDIVLASFGFDFSLFGSLLAVGCVIASVWLLTEPHLNQFFWGNTAEEIQRASEHRMKGSESDTPVAPLDGPGSGASAPSTAGVVHRETTAESLVERSVDRLSSSYGLTPREQEVFQLMAQGRSATFIAEQLFVSSNTVRKHIAHVYEKLGVHSKQELLTLVQQESLRTS